MKQEDYTDYVQHFNSINEFYGYIMNNPVNPVFKPCLEHYGYLSSDDKSSNARNFTMTGSFEEATRLLKYGWTTKTKEITKSIDKYELTNTFTQKTDYDVCGYQPCVPRYLQGIPTNMINSRKIQKQQKVVSLVQSMNFSVSVDSKEILNQCLGTLALVKDLESKGQSVKLSLIFGTSSVLMKNKKFYRQKIIVKITLKKPGERLNISKLSFPLVHPSMIRRIFFRFMERHHGTILSSFVGSYGSPMSKAKLKPYLNKGEQII